jgi:hypothetical protein
MLTCCGLVVRPRVHMTIHHVDTPVDHLEKAVDVSY